MTAHGPAQLALLSSPGCQDLQHWSGAARCGAAAVPFLTTCSQPCLGLVLQHMRVALSVWPVPSVQQASTVCMLRTTLGVRNLPHLSGLIPPCCATLCCTHCAFAFSCCTSEAALCQRCCACLPLTALHISPACLPLVLGGQPWIYSLYMCP